MGTAQAAGTSQMSLVATPGTLVTNQQATLFAVVTGSSGSPAGTITFKSGSKLIAGCAGQPITPSSPTAICQTSFAASTSPERLTAVFAPGPTSTAPGAVASTTLTVQRDLSTVSLGVAGSVEIGQIAIYSATVAPPAIRPGPVEPWGVVDFFDNGQPIPSCQSQVLYGGVAWCALAYTAVGNDVISARYSGDADFADSTSAPQTISVIPVPVPLPVPVPVSGIVTSTMQWLFSFTRHYTRVRALSIEGASPPASVLVTCRGGGCQFAKRTLGVSETKRCGDNGRPRCNSSGTVSLAQAFKKPLHVGTTITVLISRPGWIGKYYRFVIRPGRAPRIQINCLAPGGTRPGVGCST